MAKSTTVVSSNEGGIKWSAPVLIRKEAGALVVSVPDKVISALKLGVGDVLNFTELPGGSIEVWPVRKSTYASLDDMTEVVAKPKKKSVKKGAKK